MFSYLLFCLFSMFSVDFQFGGTWKANSCCTSSRALKMLGASLVAQTVKTQPAGWSNTAGSIPREDPLEKGMATHSSILAWGIPWIEELGGLYSPWGHKESGTTEQLISLSLSLWKGRFSSLIVQIKILSLSLAWIGFCVHPWTYLCGHKEKLL